MAAEAVAWRGAARTLWLEGITGRQIAGQLGVPLSQIWNERTRAGWPDRRAHPEHDRLVGLAAQLWRKRIPRVEIALLCGVGLSTIDNWRAHYNWPVRQAGRYLRGDLIRPSLARQPVPVRKQQKEHRPAARWRCCGWLLEGPTCPTCHRPSPLGISACIS